MFFLISCVYNRRRLHAQASLEFIALMIYILGPAGCVRCLEPSMKITCQSKSGAYRTDLLSHNCNAVKSCSLVKSHVQKLDCCQVRRAHWKERLEKQGLLEHEQKCSKVRRAGSHTL